MLFRDIRHGVGCEWEVIVRIREKYHLDIERESTVYRDPYQAIR